MAETDTEISLAELAEKWHESRMPSSSDLDFTGAQGYAARLDDDTPPVDIFFRVLRELRVSTRDTRLNAHIRQQAAAYEEEVAKGEVDGRIVDALPAESALRSMFEVLRDMAEASENTTGLELLDDAEQLGCFVVSCAVADLMSRAA